MPAVEKVKQSGAETEIEEVVADEGYHAAKTNELADDLNFCTYTPERKSSIVGDSPTNPQRFGEPSPPTGAAGSALKVANFGTGAANNMKRPSPVSAIPAACGGVGCNGER